MGPDAKILVFECWILSQVFTLLFHLHQEALLFLLAVYHKHGIICISEAIDFSWQSWFQLVFLPVQRFSWCTLHISWISRVTIYSLDVLLFPIWKQSIVPRPVLTVASWSVYRFLRRHVRWSGIPISWRIFHSFVIYTVKGFGLVNKAEVDVCLELSCFFDDPTNVGNLNSGSSAFSKSSLNI